MKCIYVIKERTYDFRGFFSLDQEQRDSYVFWDGALQILMNTEIQKKRTEKSLSQFSF